MIYNINFILNSLLKNSFLKKYSLVYSKEAEYCMGLNAYKVIVREIMHFKHAKISSQMLNSFEKKQKKYDL